MHRQEILLPDEVDLVTKDSFVLSRHMHAAQTMIRNQFPDIGGLFCISLGKNVKFPETKSDRLLQIITETNHWVLIAKGFMSCKEVMIFDSLSFEPSKREHVIACICSLFRTDGSTITYRSDPVNDKVTVLIVESLQLPLL
jgi:hypothetical protein